MLKAFSLSFVKTKENRVVASKKFLISASRSVVISRSLGVIILGAVEKEGGGGEGGGLLGASERASERTSIDISEAK